MFVYRLSIHRSVRYIQYSHWIWVSVKNRVKTGESETGKKEKRKFQPKHWYHCKLGLIFSYAEYIICHSYQGYNQLYSAMKCLHTFLHAFHKWTHHRLQCTLSNIMKRCEHKHELRTQDTVYIQSLALYIV